MASRKDIEAGKAFVTIYAKDSPLVKGLAAISGKMNAWGKSIMLAGAGVLGLGASITAAFVPALNTFSEVGSELADMSAKTGVAAGSLAELKFAAEQSGTSLEAVEKALIAMSKRGLDPKNFDKYAAQIAALPAGMKQIERAMEVWGKSGAELIPMLADLQALRQEARQFGLVPTQAAVEMAAKFGDTLDKLVSVFSAAMFNVGAALAPVLLPIAESVIKITAGISRWIQQNGKMVPIIAAIGVALTVIGGIIVGIGAAFIAVGAIISGVATIIGFLLTPVGAIVVAVVAIGTAIVVGAEYWLLFTKAGQKTAEDIKAAFGKAIDSISSAIKGIGDALMAGDLVLAAGIAAKQMEVLFMRSIDAIIERAQGIWMLLPGAQAGPLAVLMGGDRAAQAEKELEILNRLAANRREAAWSDSGKKDSMSFSESMKSLGSFNPYALSLQNYGKGDGVQKRQEDVLKKIADEMFPRLIKAVQESGAKWGE